MQKRIEELTEGRIACTGPKVEFSASRMDLEVVEGEDFKGEFTIISSNQIPVQGKIYASNPRMECLTENLDGNEVKVRYEFHSAGLTEGDRSEGDFFVICSQGEYTFPFAVDIARMCADKKAGTIRNLSDFAKAAQNHWQETKKIFYAPDFMRLLKTGEGKERLLYEGIVKGPSQDKNLEEFLIACGLKEPVFIKAGQSKFSFSKITERLRQNITISKSTWGYVELDMISDADFIEPERNRLEQEDFLGKETVLGFYLNPKKMHAGKNFGRLVLKNRYQELSISVSAALEAEDASHNLAGRQIRQLHVRLMQAYVDYRLKKIVTGKWTMRTCGILDDLTELDSKNLWYRLLKAQALWLNGQRQEAEWILNAFKRKQKDRKSPEWGYYMYICTLMEREELYINRLTEEIEQIYLEHQDHILLFWCLLFLRENYTKDCHQKLKAIGDRVMQGSKSPLLYVEAYVIFSREPYLMTRLGDFEIEVLNWARKQGMLTEDLADQVGSVFSERLTYQRTVYLLLEECYAVTEDEHILAQICGYLIRNQKYGRQFFRWYARGVQEKIRIAGLYEAYLMSMDTQSVQEVPQIIQMYFKYNNQLATRQKAVLYVNIIAAKERQPEAYRQHYPAMEQFAYDQMKLGRMDDNLAVIYKDVLAQGIRSPQVFDVLSDILFVHKLTCAWPEAARVVILQKQLKNPKIVPILDHAAYFPLYSNDYCILIEDRFGNRYGSSVDYQLEKLMYPGRYLKMCMQNAPENLPYLLYYFADREMQGFYGEKDILYFQRALLSDDVDLAYKAELFPKMFSLMCRLDRAEDMEREFCHADLSLMSAEDRRNILENCLEQRLFEQVYAIAAEYGFLEVPAAKRVPFISYQIQKLDFAEDEPLLSFCEDTFFEGKYNDAMLRYLCRYYQGPTTCMADIFKSALEFGIDAKELAGRILVQMLYTGEFTDCTGKVYKSFETGGNPRIKEAYLTYFSYYSLVGEGEMPESFFEALRTWQADGHEMNGICAGAMLKYYTMQPSLMEKEEERAEALLLKCLFHGLYFAFYKDFSPDFIRKYLLYDKYYIEYQTKKNSRVWIRYTKKGGVESAAEEMTEVYEGIFTKEMILFSGESVQYAILEESGGEMEVKKSGEISCSASQKDAEESRYQRLNQMTALLGDGNETRLLAKMCEYRQLDHMAGEMFTVI